MRCDGCRKQVETRFAIFTRTEGYLVFSRWECRPTRLCDRCLGTRFWKWTLVSAALGWWGTFSFVRTLAAIPGNVLEYRLALAQPAYPVEPTESEAAEEEERMTRRALARDALGPLPWGLLFVTMGLCFFMIPRSSGRPDEPSPGVLWEVFTWGAGILGILLIVAAVRGRHAAFAGPLPPEPEPESAPEPEPAAASRAAADRTSAVRGGPPLCARRRR